MSEMETDPMAPVTNPASAVAIAAPTAPVVHPPTTVPGMHEGEVDLNVHPSGIVPQLQ